MKATYDIHREGDAKCFRKKKASSRPESEIFSKLEVMRKETDLSIFTMCVPQLCLTPAQPARKKSWVTFQVTRSKEAPPLFSLIAPILSLSQIFSPHPGGSDGKASAYNAGDLGSIPVWEDPLEKEVATHSSILAWKIPWTEKPGRLQLMGSQRVRHYWATSHSCQVSEVGTTEICLLEALGTSWERLILKEGNARWGWSY